MEQRSPEWYQARVGKFTASRMADLMATGKTGKPLKSYDDYIVEIFSERLSGKPTERVRTFAMERGANLEPEALDMYSFEAGNTVKPEGFVVHPHIKNLGASPDGLIGDKGLVEIKCPLSTVKHVKYLTEKAHAVEYKWQVQTQLFVMDRDWCDLCSYHPAFAEHNLELAIVRVEKDIEMHKAISERVEEAEAHIAELFKKLEALSA